MRKIPQEHLLIGRAALARAFCADWISAHSGIIFTSLASLIVITFCAFHISNRFFSSHKSDPLRAEQAFRAWVTSKEADPLLLQKLESPLNREPSLKAKFGALIAQRLLTLGDVTHAQAYARDTLKRTLNLTSSYYTRFASNTLSISKGGYQEALQEAKQLKTDLDHDEAFWTQKDKIVRSGAILYAYNLLRIASLEQAVGSVQGELNAWEDLLHHSGWVGKPQDSRTYDAEAYSLLASNFQEGETSLLDFIRGRQLILKTAAP